MTKQQHARPALRDIFAEAWKSDRGEFPFEGKVNYQTHLANIEDHLNTNVHRSVEKLAIAHGAGYLTNHGPQHVEDVMRQAADLAAAIKCRLSGYEAYLLMVAIHFHDVGNMFGREKHEQQIEGVMQALGAKAGRDRLEKKLIERIACAHGGWVGAGMTDRDTLGKINEDDNIGRAVVRPQLLAALLRFGDEIAEDQTRADGVVFEIIEYVRAQSANGRAIAISEVPEASEVYHRYAKCLHSCVVKPASREIHLKFEPTMADLSGKLRKGSDEVYLFDEIKARVYKLRKEMIYFSRYAKGEASIDFLNVDIEVLQDDQALQPLEQIQYRFQDRGYPEDPRQADLNLIFQHAEGKQRNFDGKGLVRKLKTK